MNKVLLMIAGFVAVYASSVDGSSAQLAEASDSAAQCGAECMVKAEVSTSVSSGWWCGKKCQRSK